MNFVGDVKSSLLEEEFLYLNKYAKYSSKTEGRLKSEDESNDFRLCYQRDKGRIIHSKFFRRLKGKTQVFLFPVGDHYRTRLTHTLEVSQIATTIARALKFNEDLTEAIALGHDLGHTPFGHLGEKALNEIIPGGFHHAMQSERIATQMNLTIEVIDGIRNHTKGKGSSIIGKSKTLEGQVVRLADIIAYLNHDLEDSVRAGLIKYSDIPKDITNVLGLDAKERFTTMINSVVKNTSAAIKEDFKNGVQLYLSDDVYKAMEELRSFLFKNVYENNIVIKDFEKIYYLCNSLYKFLIGKPEKLINLMGIEELYDDISKVICDYISGMTDGYAIKCYKSLFLPASWETDEIFKLIR